MEPSKVSAEDSDFEVESTEEDEMPDPKEPTRAHIGVMSELDKEAADPMASLPPQVRRRINALKNLQLSVIKLDAAFYMEVHALEMKYMRLYYPFLDKRADIVNGRYEPTEAECQWEGDSDDQQAITDGIQKAAITEGAEAEKPAEDVKGIPGFWLTIFKNVNLLSEMVQEHDEPILEYLEDIKVIMLEKDPIGFVLEFHFRPNEYFTNSVLTKEYNMKCQPDADHPFDFEGPEIYKCIGCSIMWCKDKNVTVKTVKKRQKHKQRGSVRTVFKTIPTDSFFNFFNPPELPSDPTEEVADSIKTLLTTDFEIGHYIRERVVPFAVLLYTGEGLDDEEDYEEEEEEEEEESSSEEESSEEEKPAQKGNAGKKNRSGRIGTRGPRHPSTNDESNDDENRATAAARRGGVRAAGKGGKTPQQQQQQPPSGGAAGGNAQQNPAECKQQ